MCLWPHLHVCQAELAALCHEVAVDGHTRTAIKVEAPAITALLVGIQVDATSLQDKEHTNSRATLLTCTDMLH